MEKKKITIEVEPATAVATVGLLRGIFPSIIEQLEALRHHFPNISKAMEEGKDLLKQITRSRGFGMGM